MYKIGRPINGIGLNGLEWLLDDNGNEMLFDTPEHAKGFLRDNGHEDWSDDDFEDSYMFRFVNKYGELSGLLLTHGVTVLIDTTDFDDSEVPVEDLLESRCKCPEAIEEGLINFIRKNSGASDIVLQEDEEGLGLIIDAYDGDDNYDGQTYWWDDYNLPF